MRRRPESVMERLHRQTVNYCEFALHNWCRYDEDESARTRWTRLRDDAQRKLETVRSEQGYTGTPR